MEIRRFKNDTVQISAESLDSSSTNFHLDFLFILILLSFID
jgi:hypothetical protein